MKTYIEHKQKKVIEVKIITKYEKLMKFNLKY